MNLREAAQQALEALEKHDAYYRNGIPQTWFDFVGKPAITDLRTALADTQDWDEIEALLASLREHMAEIHRLRAAGRQALEALEVSTRFVYADLRPQCEEAITALRTALAEDAPETNFGNMAQTVDSKEADHIPDATEMMASVREDRTVEPVGYGVFEDGNLHDSFRLEHEAKLFAALKGEHAEVHALYTAPPKREPLTEEKILAISVFSGWDAEKFARAIERAHGIGGEE